MTIPCNQSIFKLEHTAFSYPGEEPVLKDVSFQVEKGERVCILGANGSGKSTLLKIFAGLLLPQSGVFTAFGEEITEKKQGNDVFSREYHRRIGFIFQDSDAQLFCSTAEEEIAFGLLQQNLPRETIAKRIKEIAGLFEIGHLLPKPPFRLSGGEKKKVALASVLVMNPDVLLLDEPTSGLDPRTCSWLVRLLDSLSRAGKTLIISTHNLDLVPRLADRAILLSEEHEIMANRSATDILQNIPMLKEANLVDEEYSAGI